jgi:OOP family OmpA-OmpF porin
MAGEEASAQARAASVRAWMLAKGIAPSRMTAKGFGPDNPIAPNTTADGRAQNRRIEFLRTK